jgi:hypothetical protein
VMMLGIIPFYRPVLHREQGAILCDSWFHIRSAKLCLPRDAGRRLSLVMSSVETRCH